MLTLRPYQASAVEIGIDFLTGKTQGGAIIVAPTAAGKSIYIASIAHALDGNTLVLQPSLEILEQNVAKAEMLGIKDIAIFSASAGKKDIGKCTFATIGSIVKHKDKLASFQHLIIDECFVAGTKVGEKNIEDIEIGDYVDSYNHSTGKIEKRKVLATMANEIKNDLVLTRVLDEVIISTGSHPFFVEGKGYVSACKLLKGDKLYANRNLSKKKSLFKNVLHNLWEGNTQSTSLASMQIQKEQTNLLFNYLWQGIFPLFIFKKDDGKKSNAERGNEKKGFRHIEKNRSQASNPRRKWSWHDRSTKKFVRSTWCWLVFGISSANREEKQGRLSSPLQSRHSESSKDDSCGSRWRNALFSLFSKKGQEKNGIVGKFGVQSVEIYKQGNKFGLSENSKNNFVYNIEVEGNNNYFANGVLVHNCHTVNAKGGMYEELIEFLGGKVLGLTATPYRLHAYTDFKTGQLSVVAKFLHRTRPRMFSKIIHITQVGELYAQGYLCPIEYTTHKEYKHSEIKLNSTGMDFDEEALAKYNIAHSVIEIITTIVSKGYSNHYLVFASNVEEATLLSENLKRQNISAAVISAKTPKIERAQILEDFKSGKIKVVTNFGTLTTGFDFPALDCVILGRPTQSVALYYQMMGRGIRTSEGKETVRVVDICGNVPRFGRIETFEIVEEKEGMHRLKSDASFLTGYCFYNNRDLEEEGYKGQNEKEFASRDEIIQFGAHKGKHVSITPQGYLEWAAKNMTGKWQAMFKKELERRIKSRQEKNNALESPF